MASNRFSANVTVLTILVSVTGSLFFWSLTQDNLVIAKFSIAVIWVLMVAGLIHYLSRTNRGLSNFLQTVRTLDTSRPVPEHSGGRYSMLDLTYSDIMESIQEVKIEKEADYHYFRNLIENVATGLISFDDSGNIDIMNNAAASILKTGKVSTLARLESKLDGFSEFLYTLPGNRSILTRQMIGNEMVSLSVRKVTMKKQEKEVSLVSIHNISSELEEEELVVWQKLIGVLTHEIMNSVSPIKSLTGTLSGMVNREMTGTGMKYSNKELMSDLSQGLSAIETRSRGLMQFVEAYRRLTGIPGPIFTENRVSAIVQGVLTLMKNEAGTEKIEFKYAIHPPDLILSCDERLVSQVLINLVSNAIFAIGENQKGAIEIDAGMGDDNRVWIVVKDTGKGIPNEIKEKIFIPFFTTREKGSGIGLSLVRQVMHMHRGSVKVSSTAGFTEFTLTF